MSISFICILALSACWQVSFYLYVTSKKKHFHLEYGYLFYKNIKQIFSFIYNNEPKLIVIKNDSLKWINS